MFRNRAATGEGGGARPGGDSGGAGGAGGAGGGGGEGGGRGLHPLARLSRGDQELVAELVLHSGSLKGLAKAYGVSYPTIRQRLDRVIERLRELMAGREPDELGELLSEMVARGEMSVSSARAIRETARKQVDAAARRAAAPAAAAGGENNTEDGS